MVELVATQGVNGFKPLIKSDVTTDGSKPPVWTDSAAAAIVWQDYNRARMYVENQAFMAQWEDNDLLYQSPYLGEDDDGNAQVSRFGVNNQTNTMADAVRAGLFSQKPFIFMRPRGKTTQVMVDAWMALLDVLFDRMKFRYWSGLGIDSQGLHGTGIWKGGWSTKKRIKYIRRRKIAEPLIDQPVGEPLKVPTKESDVFETVPKEVTESYPWIESRMIGTTLFDPGWRTPNDPSLCKYVVDVDYPTWTDLNGWMRETGLYEIPTTEELTEFFFYKQNIGAEQGSSVEQSFSDEGSAVMHAEDRSTATTIDPLDQPIMLVEHSTETHIKAILHINGRELIIRNSPNELGRIPHFTANWRSILNCGYGIGCGRLAGGDQRLEQGVLNHSLNLLAYQLSPAILIAMGTNAPTGNREVRAGGFFEVQPLGDDVRKAMAVMEMPEVPSQAWDMIKYAQESSQTATGADAQFMQGNLGGPGSSAARTATGAGAISAKANGRIQTPVENIEMGLIVPYTNMLIDMVKMKMPAAEIREILTSRLSDAIMKQIDIDSFLDAEMTVEVLAGAKLAAKAAMAAQLPYLMQIFQQPQLLEQLHAEGKTVDLQVILDVLFAVSEFRNEKDIIRDLTPTEMQAVQSSNAGQQKTQSAIAVEQVKGANALAKSDRDAENKLGTTVAEQALQKTGEGIPLAHASGLVMRDGDEQVLRGQSSPVLAGV